MPSAKMAYGFERRSNAHTTKRNCDALCPPTGVRTDGNDFCVGNSHFTAEFLSVMRKLFERVARWRYSSGFHQNTGQKMLPLRSLQNCCPAMMEIGLILALLCSSCVVATPQVLLKPEGTTCELGNTTDCPQSSITSEVTRKVEESGVLGEEKQDGEKKSGLSAVASASANRTVTADADVVKKSEDGVTITVAAGASVGERMQNETDATSPPEEDEAVLPTIALKAAIQDRDIDAVAAALRKFDNVEALAEGFKFPDEERAQVLERTPARNDADVVTIKGIARAALQDKNFVRLADVIVLSLTPEDGKFPPGYSASRIKATLLKLLSNKRLMRQVLTSDPATTSRRRLLVDAGSPANSMFCAYCWKRSVCRQAVWWC